MDGCHHYGQKQEGACQLHDPHKTEQEILARNEREREQPLVSAHFSSPLSETIPPPVADHQVMLRLSVKKNKKNFPLPDCTKNWLCCHLSGIKLFFVYAWAVVPVYVTVNDVLCVLVCTEAAVFLTMGSACSVHDKLTNKKKKKKVYQIALFCIILSGIISWRTLSYITLHHIVSSCIVSCHAVLYCIMLCCTTVSNHIMCHIVSNCIVSCHIILYHIVLYCIVFYRIVSYHTAPYHIVLCLITLYCNHTWEKNTPVFRRFLLHFKAISWRPPTLLFLLGNSCNFHDPQILYE